MSLVLDSSVTVAWVYSAETTEEVADVFARVVESGAWVPALWRLEAQGLVGAEWGLSANNRKAKFYRLTTDGRRRLREEVKIWEAYATAVAKVLGAKQLPAPEKAG